MCSIGSGKGCTAEEEGNVAFQMRRMLKDVSREAEANTATPKERAKVVRHLRGMKRQIEAVEEDCHLLAVLAELDATLRPFSLFNSDGGPLARACEGPPCCALPLRVGVWSACVLDRWAALVEACLADRGDRQTLEVPDG